MNGQNHFSATITRLLHDRFFLAKAVVSGHGFKIIGAELWSGPGGVFVAMPRRSRGNRSSFIEVTDATTRQQILEAVKSAYERVVA